MREISDVLESVERGPTRWPAFTNNEQTISWRISRWDDWQREVVARAERKLETPAIIVQSREVVRHLLGR